MAKDLITDRNVRKQQGAQMGTVRVDVTYKGNKTQEAVYKSEEKTFRIIADEPQVRGGQGEGPSCRMIPITTEVRLNGRKVVSFTREP